MRHSPQCLTHWLRSRICGVFIWLTAVSSPVPKLCAGLLAHDNSPEIRALLQEGVLDFTIDQNLSYQTRKALSVLFDAVLEHKRPKKDSYYPDSPILTAENC